MTARDTYIERMKLELDRLNDQLSSLEARASHARQEARDQYEVELIKLRGHSRDALTQWEALKTSSEQSWHEWASDMDRLHDAFTHAFRDFKAQLGAATRQD